MELRGFYESNGTVYDPDQFVWNIAQGPSHGTFQQVNGSTYRYVPNPGYVGDDVILFRSAPVANAPNIGTITIHVTNHAYGEGANQFPMPYGLPYPSFGLLEDEDEYSRPPSQVQTIDLSQQQAIPTTLEAGDVVQLTGASLPGAPVAITANGTATNPIFIRGATSSTSPRAILRHGLRIKGDYVIIEYIDFDASQAGSQTRLWVQVAEQTGVSCQQEAPMAMGPDPVPDYPLGSTHVAVRHCSFFDHATGQPGVAAMLFGATHGDNCPLPDNDVTLITDCVVYDTLVRDFGDWEVSGSDYGAVGFEGNTKNMWCLDSVFHHIQSTGVTLSRNNALSRQLPATRGFVGRNVIHHMSEFAIQCKMARDSIISQNKMYRVRQVESSFTGGGVSIDNDDHCNVRVNESGYHYSDNVWVVFNEIYDTQAGVASGQQIHCGGGTCCCPSLPESCCNSQDPFYEGPSYEPSRVYIVGNVFHHIWPFTKDPAESGQAVFLGNQVQARVVNNTLYKCHQGIHIICTNTGECPPGEDPNNKTRNTLVTVVNNVILDTPDSDDNDSHVRVCRNPYIGDPSFPFTLANGELGFGHNLHFGGARAFRIPSAAHLNPPYFDTVERLVADPLTDYGIGSQGDLAADNPNLESLPLLKFQLRTTNPASPQFMFTGGFKDASYDAFLLAFPGHPHIYRDFAGNAYSGQTCAIGAYGTDVE